MDGRYSEIDFTGVGGELFTDPLGVRAESQKQVCVMREPCTDTVTSESGGLGGGYNRQGEKAMRMSTASCWMCRVKTKHLCVGMGMRP